MVKPVYEKMAEIVARHIAGQGIVDLWLAGGACMQPGVHELFRQRFPALPVHLPQHSLFMTPLAIANSGREKAEGCMQAELQTALFHAFDTLNLQQMKSFNVPPVTLHGVGALAACGPQAQSRGLRHLFVMVDSFLHQAGMTAGLERSGDERDCYDSLALSRRRTLRHRCLRRRRPAAGRAATAWWPLVVDRYWMRRRRWRCWSPILSRRWGDDGAQRVAPTSAADRGADHRWHRV